MSVLHEQLLNSLPEFEIPNSFENVDLYLKYLTIKGVENHYLNEKQAGGKIWEIIKDRAEYELNLIILSKHANYFLIVMDYVNWAIKQKIPVGPGRGAGTSSIVAYALRITNIDPLKYNLLFERFINTERIAIPDFDIDFADKGRNDVINYVTEKYGRECVKKIFIFSKKDPNQKPSIHPCGVIIAKKDILDLSPFTFPDENNDKPSPYDLNDLEDYGLIRFDFLGLRTLDIIKITTEVICQQGGKYSEFSLVNIPENDEKTFEMLGKGDSSGVFQFESDGMKEILKQAKPKTINDLVAINSLYRPGLLDRLSQLIEGKNNQLEVKYTIPEFEEILKETYGVVVFQEQVMQIIHCVAGYSLGKADILRRILGKYNHEDIDREKKQFISCATAKGYNEETSDNIFESLILSAKVAFNKSHAVAYSFLAYQTAYLKAHFPNEYEISFNRYLRGNQNEMEKED